MNEKMSKSVKEKEWIITPGLIQRVEKFRAHLKAAKGDPILITGPTGVGKTLFLALFEYFDEEETQNSGKKSRDKGKAKKSSVKRKIIEANCSHFGGKNSDLNIARSELFGMKKGIINTLTADIKGLVEEADGGVLILEEIGELPDAVQAMLLTFVETGEYRIVGDTKTKRANVLIVGATNHPEKLRPELLNRFFPFYVPPLHVRRIDVLYYFFCFFPDITKSLKFWEVLLLMAYNWPGNVREIQLVGRLIERELFIDQAYDDKKLPPFFKDSMLCKILFEENKNTNLDPLKLIELQTNIIAFSEIYIDELEELLNVFNIGIDVSKKIEPDKVDNTEDTNNGSVLKSRPFSDVQFSFNNDREIKISKGIVRECLPNEAILLADAGFKLFCSFFLKDYISGEDVINIGEGEISKYMPKSEEYIINILGSRKELTKETFKYSKEIKELMRPNKLLLEKMEGIKNFWSMTKVELLVAYYKGLLFLNNDNVNAAARHAGIINTTFRSQLENLEIDFKKQKKTPDDSSISHDTVE